MFKQQSFNDRQQSVLSKPQGGVKQSPPMMSNTLNPEAYPIQRIKATLPAEAWRRGLEKDPASKFHVSATRHSVIVPGGRGYPHLTIDIESTQFSKDRRSVHIEFSMAHYSVEEKGLRIPFFDDGKGHMACGRAYSELIKKALRQIDGWTKGMKIGVSFVDDRGQSFAEIKAAEFFEHEVQSSSKDVEQNGDGAEGASADMESTASAEEPRVKELEVEVSVPNPKKKGKKKGKKENPFDWEAMMAEVDKESQKLAKDTGKKKKGKAKPKSTSTPVDKESSAAQKPNGDDSLSSEWLERERIRKEWEDFLEIPDFSLIGEDLYMDKMDPQDLQTVMSLYNPFLGRLGSLSKRQLSKMTDKVKGVDGIFSRMRSKVAMVSSGRMKKDKAHQLIQDNISEIELISSKLVPTEIHHVKVHDLVPEMKEEHRQLMLPYYRASFGLFFSTMGVYFLNIRILEYYSMILSNILHISRLQTDIGSGYEIDYEHFLRLMIDIQHTHSISADAILPHGIDSIGMLRSLPAYQKNKFSDSQKQLDRAIEIFELSQEVVRKTSGLSVEEWMRLNSCAGEEMAAVSSKYAECSEKKEVDVASICLFEDKKNNERIEVVARLLMALVPVASSATAGPAGGESVPISSGKSKKRKSKAKTS
ncbi:hypothetical protein [Aureibacter tunicatorum]|uniref:Uncharacterized protein n=1 Tax=Aureibacter tunicatorum TaxID=866807 RepID=A0AAE4BRK3_9BACT|nr:hypothetical protein [Aureibacter tunicatorum]MDR6240309.1 hypothetical protein [Aureibacter tunicatorum]BDD05810.1 hypothetical protein AUTU_32930 [Aureibacter tunicatorum]